MIYALEFFKRKDAPHGAGFAIKPLSNQIAHMPQWALSNGAVEACDGITVP